MATTKIALADALLRRKELEGKVKMLSTIKANMIIETVATRVKAHEGLDDVVAKVSKVEANQVTSEFDHYSKALRLVDSRIQQANWNTQIEVDQHAFEEWKKPEKPTASV